MSAPPPAAPAVPAPENGDGAARRSSRRSLLVFGLLTTAFVLLGLSGDVRSWLNVEGLRAQARSLGPWAPAILVAAGALMPLALLPRWPLAFVCGVLYGLVWGVLLANAASTVGAWLQFDLARRAAGPAPRRAGGVLPRWRRLLEPRERAFVALFLLRAFPLSNFVATNLLAGFLRLPPRTYLAATFLGMLPSSILYAAWGKLVRKPDAAFYAVVLGALVFLVAGTLLAQRRFLGTRRAAAGAEPPAP
jgi:uncharacterized membrane protein YdjX (TVP38/TMEM64 family)